MYLISTRPHKLDSLTFFIVYKGCMYVCMYVLVQHDFVILSVVGWMDQSLLFIITYSFIRLQFLFILADVEQLLSGAVFD